MQYGLFTSLVSLFLRAKVIPVIPQIHGNVMCPLFVLNFIFEPLFVHAPHIIVFMKQSIHIRCTQHFLYFESHKKIIKTATHYCLFQCTFYQFCIYNMTVIRANVKKKVSGI
jgi:hypothetical protein